MLLFLLYKHINKKLGFKGGTALYKLHSLNRFSNDLDFTLIYLKLDMQKLLRNIIVGLKDISIYTKIKELEEFRNQKNIKLEIKGPLYKGNINDLSLITINLSLKERPLYEAQQEKIFSQYKEIPSFDVFVMNLNEILSEKIRTLFSRDKARDLYDVWFLLKKGVKFNINDVNKKLRLNNMIYNKEDLIVRIEEKKKFWEMDLKDIIMGELPSFEKIKKEVIENL